MVPLRDRSYLNNEDLASDYGNGLQEMVETVVGSTLLLVLKRVDRGKRHGLPELMRLLNSASDLDDRCFGWEKRHGLLELLEVRTMR